MRDVKKVSIAVGCKSKKSEEFGADGQDLFVLVYCQAVLPSRRDRRSVALATRVVADPLDRPSRQPLVNEPVDVLGVCGEVTDDVVVHQRVDTVRIVTHQKATSDKVARHSSTVQHRLHHHFLRTCLHMQSTSLQHTQHKGLSSPDKASAIRSSLNT